MDNLKIVIPGKPEYVTMIRLATSSLAAKAGFDLDDVEDIKMAVAEACKNVSCHSSEGWSSCCVKDPNIRVFRILST